MELFHICAEGAALFNHKPVLRRRKRFELKNKVNKKWIIQIVTASFITSVVFNFASSEILGNAGYITAFIALAFFVGLGIVFDIVGVAVTSATPAPFHSMASHRERGAAEALSLLKNAEKVASICNDVVGDISSIVSGSTSAIIVTSLMDDLSSDNILIQLGVSGAVAAVTIGGKALGKTMAMNNSTSIVLFVGKIVSIKSRFARKKRGK